MRPVAFRYPPYPRIGIPIVSDVADAVVSVVKDLPLGTGDWVIEAVNNGAEWVGDFAKNPVGLFALQVLTSSLAAQIGRIAIPSVSGMQTIGPQLASVVFALPGTVAGKDFTRAYIEELTSRAVATAAYLTANPAAAQALGTSLGASAGTALTNYAAGAAVTKLDAVNDAISFLTKPIQKALKSPEFQRTLNSIIPSLPFDVSDRAKARKVLRDAHLTPPEVAKKFGLPRPDLAALAINGQLGRRIYAAGYPEEGVSEFDILGRPNRTYENAERGSGAKDADLPVILSTGPSPFDVKLPPLPPAPRPTTLPSPTGRPEVTFVSSSKGGVISQLLTVALLTSPAWLTIFVLPRVLPKFPK